MNGKAKYDRSDLRRLNGINVLDQLRRNGPMSRANIASQLGLTRATVSNIVAEFLDTELVQETEYLVGAAGRPGLLLVLNANYCSMIAVEIDLDQISILVTNFGQKTLWLMQKPVTIGMSLEETLAVAEGLVQQALKVSEEKGLRCYGIGTALAGLVNHQMGQLEYGPTSGWEVIPLKEKWEKQFKVPVFIENEAHAGVLGVQHFGSTRGERDIIYLSIGVGLAAGIFSDGELLRGNKGFAGQVGHTRFSENKVVCGCGKQGCWVTEIGASAVHRKLMAAGIELPDAQETDIDWLEAVSEKARLQDPVVQGVLDELGQQVGQGLAKLVLTFNPSVVMVGGRLGKLMKHAESSIRQGLMEDVLPYMKENLKLVVSDAQDDQLKGCLATVYDYLMKNPKLG